MTSYISTQTIASWLRQSVLQMQSDLETSATELSSGIYADLGLTLGARTAESVSLQSENSLLQTITDTNQSAATRLSTTQTVLGNMQTAAQNLLNALLQENGSTSNAASIQALGQSNLKNLISNLNTTLNGDYIFAGTNTGNEPVTDYYAPSAANKAAIDTAFLSAFGVSQTSASVSTISAAAGSNVNVRSQDYRNLHCPSCWRALRWRSNLYAHVRRQHL